MWRKVSEVTKYSLKFFRLMLRLGSFCPKKTFIFLMKLSIFGIIASNNSLVSLHLFLLAHFPSRRYSFSLENKITMHKIAYACQILLRNKISLLTLFHTILDGYYLGNSSSQKYPVFLDKELSLEKGLQGDLL